MSTDNDNVGDYNITDSTDHKNQLSEAVEHANLMLMHATEQGLALPDQIIDKVVKARYLESKNAWNETDEAEFWYVFRDLSQTIRPVTIDSILAANEKNSHPTFMWRLFGYKKGTTLTRKAVQRYTRYALISLAGMLIIQIYSLIGNTILQDIKERDKKIQSLEEEIILQQDLGNNQKAIAIELQKDVVADEREKNIELLARWLRPIDYILLKEPADLSIFQKSKDDKEASAEVYKKINDLGIRVKQSAQHPILIISGYILPLLYGLLGAYAYVLRVLSEEIKMITYSKDSDIKYILRINLGALAGLAVGLVFVPDSQHFVTINLPPLTLAFIAGYSIEFLFTAVDKFISSVGRTEPKVNAS